MSKKQKLELTWIGKDQRPKLEPRILIEDPDKSYHASERVSENDIFDNMLIHGDNLLALKALEQDYSGKIKCVFIDPPYNTGAAFNHYDDSVEHSVWLSLMYDRIRSIYRLLADDGSMWVVLNDEEAHYFKVMCDEIFGRNCFVTSVVWRHSDNSNNNVKRFSEDHNYLIVYSKEPDWTPKFLNDPSKRTHFKNPDNDPKGPWFDGNPLNNPALRPNLQYTVTSPTGYEIPHPPNGWRWSKEKIMEKISTGEIRFTDDGKSLRRRTYLRDMAGLAPSSLWADVKETGHTRQAKYELKNLFPDRAVTDLFDTPKPERLVKRVLELATNENDLVLDSFLGSGTTAAVAHKMKRRWIGIELGDHCDTHCLPRLKKVVAGQDLGGVTFDSPAGPEVKLCKKCKEQLCEDCFDKVKPKEKPQQVWFGGGGFRYYELGPSLIEKDKWGNPVISKEFDSPKLTQAMCKLEGFNYAPDPDIYWMQGRSSETDFIYVTSQTMSKDLLAKLSDEVGDNRSLLICCPSFRAKESEFPNLTLKKIPKAVLKKCEWGRDDYSLQIQKLPKAPPADIKEDALMANKPNRKFGKENSNQGDLFS